MRFEFTGRRFGQMTLIGQWGRIAIAPGVNEVDGDSWEMLKSDRNIKYHIDKGTLRVLEPSTTTDPTPAPEPESTPDPTPWIPTQAQLVELTGIGEVSASIILNVMPVLGFISAQQLIDLSGLSDKIDPEELNAIFGD